MSVTLVHESGHKVTTSVPTEITNLKAAGYTEYVEPEPAVKRPRKRKPVAVVKGEDFSEPVQEVLVNFTPDNSDD